MLSNEELAKICAECAPKCRDELIQQYFRQGFWGAVKAIRESLEKPAVEDTDKNKKSLPKLDPHLVRLAETVVTVVDGDSLYCDCFDILRGGESEEVCVSIGDFRPEEIPLIQEGTVFYSAVVMDDRGVCSVNYGLRETREISEEHKDAIRKRAEKIYQVANRDDGETVEVRLPVHVYLDDLSYVCDSADGEDFWEDTTNAKYETFIVTAKLPKPQPRETIEVEGEVRK